MEQRAFVHHWRQLLILIGLVACTGVARSDDLKFSVHHGIYNAPVTVTLSTDFPGATIYYTTDGSVPTAQNGAAIAGPAGTLPEFANTTTLRAVVYQGGVAVTPVKAATYIRPSSIASQPVQPAGYPSTWAGFTVDYEMDPDVLGSALPGYGLTDGLLSIPSVSIVMNHNDLWNVANGIYINSTSSGAAWERQASIELIHPDGRPGFQINACIEIHGGFSRNHSVTKKHSFRISFKGTCGPTTLEYPLFADCFRQSFDRLVLRAISTDAWAIQDGTAAPGNPDTTLRWKRESASYIRDQWMRDSQIAMGHDASHGMFVHVFLNGLYWGLYNLVEHYDGNANFHAQHTGGREHDSNNLPVDYEIYDDTMGGTAWGNLVTLANQAAGAGQAALDAYETLQGNNPNGSRNPAIQKLLDVENLIDYMILHIASSADDWPNHNWHAGRRLNSLDSGFRFYTWDQEISNLFLQKTRTSHSVPAPAYPLFQEVAVANTPAFLYDRLRLNPRFVQAFKERISKHYFNEGALTIDAATTRWLQRASEIDMAVVLESARWGDSRNPLITYTREGHWVPSNLVWMVDIFWPQIRDIALARFQSVGLYNPADGLLPLPPFFLTPGCTFPPGFQVLLADVNTPPGTIFYTVDGSDPRLASGAVSPAAAAYDPNAGITLALSTIVRARVRIGATWSAAAQEEFNQDFRNLSITEINYNPTTQNDITEFIELKNTGNALLHINELGFADGIFFPFTLPDLEPGRFLVLAKDAAAFQTAYAFAPDGAWGACCSLNNAGERVLITNRLGRTVTSLSYSPTAPWPVAADGTGRTLVPINPISNPNSQDGYVWRASNQINGSPGRDDDAGEVAWFEDDAPTGATTVGQGDSWANWVTDNPTPYSGTRSIQSIIGGPGQVHQLFFYGASSGMVIEPGDVMYAYVYIDPVNPPREIMLQWVDSFGIWEHRAFWGEDLLNWFGTRTYMGPLPAAGRWVRLEVPASSVYVEDRLVTGMAFTLYEGRATWDHAGKRSSGDLVWLDDDTPTEVGVLGEVGDMWRNWARSGPTPVSGLAAFQSGDFARQDQMLQATPQQRLHQVYFYDVKNSWYIRGSDVLVGYVYLDPDNPPQEIMLQWLDANYSWEHRAYWGPDLLNFFGSRTLMGSLPSAGQWVRLEVPAASVGLAGQTIIGSAMTAFDGKATWDILGKGDIVWVEDSPPSGATLGTTGPDNWSNWVTADPAPRSGAKAIKSSISSGLHQLFFYDAPNSLEIDFDDSVFAHVYLDPQNTPSTVMLQWFDDQGSWEHRAYWGAPPSGFPTAVNLGSLPSSGQWVRLNVPAWTVDLEGLSINGMAFTLFGGRATWDRAGKAAR